MAKNSDSRDVQAFIPRKNGKAEDKRRKCFKVNNEYLRCLLSEFLGTFVLVAIGDATVAQTVIGTERSMKLARGNITTISLGWGIAVILAVYVSGGVSGGHVNPAVTVAAAIYRKLSWKKVPFYIIGQYLGAFLGAVSVYLCYYDALNHFDGGRRSVTGENATAGIFSTFPEPHVSTFQGLVDQIFATALLVLVVYAISDSRNMNVSKGVSPIAVGFIVIALLTAYQYNCGAALNPARDLSPRLFTAMAGWGCAVFTFRDCNWFWVPVVGPHIGAVLGAGLYIACIEMHWEPQDEITEEEHCEREMQPIGKGRQKT